MIFLSCVTGCGKSRVDRLRMGRPNVFNNNKIFLAMCP